MATIKKVKKKKQQYISFSTTEVFQDFTEGDMTLVEFELWMKKKHPNTKFGVPIRRSYIHTLLSYGHLPKHMGGNKLFISKVRDIIAIRVLEEKHKFNQGSGTHKEGQKKRGPKVEDK